MSPLYQKFIMYIYFYWNSCPAEHIRYLKFIYFIYIVISFPFILIFSNTHKGYLIIISIIEYGEVGNLISEKIVVLSCNLTWF